MPTERKSNWPCQWDVETWRTNFADYAGKRLKASEVSFMTLSNKCFYWRSNPEWYRTNEQGEYELTDKAPEEARESFTEFCKPRKEMKNPFI